MSRRPQPRLFGTDGIRAAFGTYPLDEPTVTALGLHLAESLAAANGEPALVVLGGDTRESTPALASWLATGLSAGGAAVRYAGVVPTPAVAWLARRLGAAAGVAISASHNPHPDNGIKLIGGDGFKWAPEDEATLEARLLAAPRAGAGAPAVELAPEPELARSYLADLEASLPGERPLGGLRLLIDAAHGAASPYAEGLFRALGAEVEAIGARPDGSNINRGCGSTHPAALATAVGQGGFDLGIAFDGDADRALLVDERDEVRDGDAMLYLWAGDLASAGDLVPPAIVATSMSNLGLERALAPLGVRVERCGVGDREVVATLRGSGLRLGGEQSGHIVDLALATTGDGLLSALTLAHLRQRRGRPLSALLAGFRRFPQVLRNVPVERKPEFASLPRVAAAAGRVEGRLGADGRLVLRYSGTEPLARIMIEGPDQAAIEAMAGEIAEAIEEAIG